MAKKAISELPPLTASKTSKSDLLVIVNAGTTKQITLDNLFTAGLSRSSNNTISSSTTIGSNLFVADVTSDLIGIGGLPIINNILTAYGNVKISNATDTNFNFITDGGTSDNWNSAYGSVSKLYGAPYKILISNTATNITSAQLISSPTVAFNYNEGDNTVYFSTTGSISANGSIYIANNWILSDGIDAGISISANNTVAICPDGHGKTYGVGNTSSELTHVSGFAATIWGDVFIDGKIKLSNLNDSFEGFSFGTMAGQNANNVIITGGTISGVNVSSKLFESNGISDAGSSKTINIKSTNNVGIGTTSPLAKLDVAGSLKSTSFAVSNAANASVTLTSLTASSYAVLDFKNSSTSSYGIRIQSDGDTKNEIIYKETKNLSFKTANSVVSQLTNDGRLVIGPQTTTSSSYLQVAGRTSEKSSFSLINTGTNVEKYTNIFFGISVAPEVNWIKYCHNSGTTSKINTMQFGVLGDEKMRIAENYIRFMKIGGGGSEDMVWDGSEGVLRIGSKKVLTDDFTANTAVNTLALEGHNGAYYLDWGNFTNIPSLSIEFNGQVTGSGTFVDLSNTSIELSIEYDGHHHSTSTIDGLSTFFGQNLTTTSNVHFANLTVSGTITESSDKSLKENISEITGALDIINSMTGVRYNKIDTPEKTEIGFVAQELEEVLPEVVETDENGIKSVNYSRIVALLVQAVKELKNQIK